VGDRSSALGRRRLWMLGAEGSTQRVRMRDRVRESRLGVDGRMSAPVLAWGSAEEALRLSLAVPGWRGPCPVRRGKASDV
jgi:hypothetical protein